MDKVVSAQRPRGGYLDALLESSPYAVIAIDGKGVITFINRATATMLECEFRDLVGKSIVTIYDSEKSARETNRKLYLSGGIIRDHESVVKSKKGKLIPVRVSAAHLKDSSGNYMGGVGFFESYRPWTVAETKLKVYCQELEAEIEEWRDLGAPVFEPFPGLSVTTITGRLDGPRFIRIQRNILEHMKGFKTRVMLLDLSAALGGNDEIAKQLIKTVRVVELTGAQCLLLGMSYELVQALEETVTDIHSIKTYTSTQAGMETALTILGYDITKKSVGGSLG
jgi:PAS domain S-box-containing protein